MVANILYSAVRIAVRSSCVYNVSKNKFGELLGGIAPLPPSVYGPAAIPHHNFLRLIGEHKLLMLISYGLQLAAETMTRSCQ